MAILLSPLVQAGKDSFTAATPQTSERSPLTNSVEKAFGAEGESVSRLGSPQHSSSSAVSSVLQHSLDPFGQSGAQAGTESTGSDRQPHAHRRSTAL